MRFKVKRIFEELVIVETLIGKSFIDRYAGDNRCAAAAKSTFEWNLILDSQATARQGPAAPTGYKSRYSYDQILLVSMVRLRSLRCPRLLLTI